MATQTNPLFATLLRQMRPRVLRSVPLQQSSLRCSNRAPLCAAPSFIRASHSIPRPPPKQPSPPSAKTTPEPASHGDAPKSEGQRPELKNPAYYQLSFTCVPCGHRSHHNVSKQGYHKGSTLITCPDCRNRHIISDHMNIFGDRKMTIEDLMREKGQLVKRGSLGEDGDVEFWPEEAYEQQPGDADKSASTGSSGSA